MWSDGDNYSPEEEARGRPESPHDRSNRASVPQPRPGVRFVDHTDDYTPAEESRSRTNVFAFPLKSKSFSALPTSTWESAWFPPRITDSLTSDHQGTARPQSSQRLEISALSTALNRNDPTPPNQAVNHRHANSEHETQPGTEADSSSSSSSNSSTTTTTTAAIAAAPSRRAPSTFPYSNTRHGYAPGTVIVRRLGNEACPYLVNSTDCESQGCPYSHDPSIVEAFRQVKRRR